MRALIERLETLAEATVVGKRLYHGTYLSDARKIQKGGFRLERARSRGASMGPAVYVSAKRDWAQGYANDIKDEGKEAAVLTLKLKPGVKFLDVSDLKKWPTEVVERYVRHQGLPKNPVHWGLVGSIARGLKYDAAGNPKGTIAVFDPKNVQVVDLEAV
jgi:hypothetical protein